MGEFLANASRILSASERQAEISGHNIANLTTPGFKRSVAFESLVSREGQGISGRSYTQFTSGSVSNTGNNLDLALQGEAFFVIQGAEGPRYTRNGQFRRAADGALVTATGQVVLGADGRGIRLSGEPVEVTADGQILEAGAIAGRLALAEFDDLGRLQIERDGAFSATDAGVRPSTKAVVRQGMVEGSNVSAADEMVEIMAALRRAEAGQRMVAAYDELIGRVFTSLGQG